MELQTLNFLGKIKTLQKKMQKRNAKPSVHTQPIFTYSKLTMETPEQYVKFVTPDRRQRHYKHYECLK